PGSPESRSLGLPSANILAISSTGEMAVQLLPSNTLARVPLSGGAPREVLENVEAADWSPDGQALAALQLTGSKSRIEFPVGRMLYETPQRIATVRMSPKGTNMVVGRLGLLAMATKTVVPNPALVVAEDPVWARDGTEIWFLRRNLGGNGMKV